MGLLLREMRCCSPAGPMRSEPGEASSAAPESSRRGCREPVAAGDERVTGDTEKIPWLPSRVWAEGLVTGTRAPGARENAIEHQVDENEQPEDISAAMSVGVDAAPSTRSCSS
jgi:hypothetical protein